MARVVLAMSGGVDSSVAAHLLLQHAHEVIGVFMRHGYRAEKACDVPDTQSPSGSGGHKQGCCSAEDAEDARRTADRLDIPFYAVDFQEDFGRIIEYFVDEYVSGRTPNPCIVCNHWLKFGRLFQYADSVGASFVATGHYARCVRATGKPVRLCRGVDASKDQSYVLFGVPRERLARILLPVGEYSKIGIRRLAAKIGLRVADKRDSQEICFVPPGQHAQLVRLRRPDLDTSGPIVTVEGREVGRHSGIEQFTIGQRKGLGVAMGEPYFVVRIDAETRTVMIGRREALRCRELTARDTNWLHDVPDRPFRCRAQIRYNSPAVPATARRLGEDRLVVTFDRPCDGVSPGQAVVCYDDDCVLGGGWIDQTVVPFAE